MKPSKKVEKSLNNDDEKEIQLSKPKKKMFKEKNKPVRAIANVEFTEYTPVDEELEKSPKH